jgi:DNA-binding Lrp family transcriptional regulator
VIRRWGWVTLVLTPNEKLIARALINTDRDGKPAPSTSELAKAVGVSEVQVKRALSMLERYEILKKESSAGNLGYRAISHYMKWEPRLDFVFHKVSLDNGRQFNTN